LDAIHVPNPVDEAIRDLCRARFDAKQDERRGKQRLKSLLLRNGCAYLGKSGWTAEHKAYLRERPMQHPAQRAAMESYIRSIDHAGSRIEDIETQLELLCPDWELYGLATALMALKGVAWLTATSLAAELGDMRRFPSAPAMMAYLGLSPSEHSSGQRVRKGAITKAGNSHARFYLVESAQHYFRPPKVSKELTRRQIGVDQEILDLSWQAQLRLNKRYWALARRGMRVQKVQVAVARELAGFVWAVGQKEWLYDPGDD
jgi:transposase